MAEGLANNTQSGSGSRKIREARSATLLGQDVTIGFDDGYDRALLFEFSRNNIASHCRARNKYPFAAQVLRSESINQTFSNIHIRNNMHLHSLPFRRIARCPSDRGYLEVLGLGERSVYGESLHAVLAREDDPVVLVCMRGRLLQRLIIGGWADGNGGQQDDVCP